MQVIRHTFFLISLLSLHLFANAQTDSLGKNENTFDSIPAVSSNVYDTNEKLNGAFIKGGFQDLLYTVEQPLHWHKKDWLKSTAIAGAVGGTMLLDKEIKNIFQRNQSVFANSIANVTEPIGSVYALFVFPAIYATGIISKDEKIQSIGLRGGKAVVIATFINVAAENIIRRNRPDKTADPFDYAPPFSGHKYNSMPSSHTTIAFSLATAFAQEFPDKKWVAPVAYSLASLTGLSRIYHNRHWASDVLVGAALGHFVTRAVYESGRKRKRIYQTCF